MSKKLKEYLEIVKEEFTVRQNSKHQLQVNVKDLKDIEIYGENLFY